MMPISHSDHRPVIPAGSDGKRSDGIGIPGTKPDVRAQFREQAGFDPLEVFGARADPQSRRLFLDFRAGLARRMQEEWLAELDLSRRDKPDLDLVLTHVDDRFDAGMRDSDRKSVV